MFKLVAIVYLLMNGVPLGEPMKFTNKASFETLDQCTAFKGSDQGATELASLNAMLLSRMPEGGSHTVTLGCEKGPDDGSI